MKPELLHRMEHEVTEEVLSIVREKSRIPFGKIEINLAQAGYVDIQVTEIIRIPNGRKPYPRPGEVIDPPKKPRVLIRKDITDVDKSGKEGT